MTRIRLLALVAAAATALALAGSAQAATRLNGTVGPGFTITLKNVAGKKVTTLKPGLYTIRVVDRSKIHDFRLRGPGLNKVITTVPFVGTKSFTVRLKKARYTFVCTPHQSFMKGAFTVG